MDIQNQIRVMSWNIWMGRNVNGVVDHINEQNPDVIGLQEVVEGYPKPESPNSAFLIRRELKKLGREYYVVYFPAFTSDRHPTKHDFGNAILSKYPIREATRHVLSTLEMYKMRRGITPPRDAEPRIAIEAQIEMPGKTMRVINTHLGVSQNLEPTEFTDVQMEKLMGIIQKHENTILMGDFNASRYSEYIRRISRVLRNTDPEQRPTWPLLTEGVSHHKEQYGAALAEHEMLLTHRPDQIFICDGMEIGGFSLGESTASDHKSLIADIII